MRFIIAAALVVLGVGLQATFNPQIRVLGGEPDLVFLIALAWIVRAPLEEGIALAFIGGIGLDLLSAVPLGVTTAALIVILYVYDTIRQQLVGVGIIVVLMVAFVGVIVLKLAEWAALAVVGLAPPLVGTITYVIFPSMVYNVVLLIPTYALVRTLQGAVETEP